MSNSPRGLQCVIKTLYEVHHKNSFGQLFVAETCVPSRLARELDCVWNSALFPSSGLCFREKILMVPLREPRHAVPTAAARPISFAPSVAPSDLEKVVCVQSERQQCHFDVYRAERVSLTSVLFSGGDWRWKLSTPSGAILVEGGGYSTQALCRAAIAALRTDAASATISTSN